MDLYNLHCVCRYSLGHFPNRIPGTVEKNLGHFCVPDPYGKSPTMIQRYTGDGDQHGMAKTVKWACSAQVLQVKTYNLCSIRSESD